MATATVEQTHVGPRVRALREAMGLSLRDLTQRTGVSAPMLSQVERGETSPTLAVATPIPSGPAPPLSPPHPPGPRAHAVAAAAPRRGRRRHGRAPRGAPRRWRPQRRAYVRDPHAAA